MADRSSNLPDYDKPPVIEVAFSVQYSQEIQDFSMAYVGRFWDSIDPKFSRVAELPPIQRVVEQPEDTVSGFQIEISERGPSPRIQLIHQDEGWVVQIQPDRFILNWRAERQEAEYPRFDKCFDSFCEYRRKFESFCTALGLKVPPPNQYELTYVNHVIQGEGWHSLGDLSSVFPDVGWRTDRDFLPPPNKMSWYAAFDLPNEYGRLHTSIKSARKRSDKSEVLLMELTTRGFPNSNDDESKKDWFLLGREWIVRGFADLTNPELQKRIWRRKQ